MAIPARDLVARIAPALRRWDTWGIAAAIAFFAFLTYYLVSGLMTPASVAPADQQLTMRGIHGQAERAGELGWRFSADSTTASPDGTTATYNGARATYYLAGKPAYRLTAARVLIDLRTLNYTASGGVHVWSVAGKKRQDFKTDDVLWNQVPQLLSCPKPVHVSYGGTILETAHLSINLRTGDTQFGRTTIESGS